MAGTGDTLLLASDGITEAMFDSSMLKQDGLWKLLQKQKQPLCLDNLLARIQADTDTQEDDQTILALEVL
jgi:serine phosphatase RsbU (regulator of sigma subunit)